MNILAYGPLNKSLHTRKFELFVKCILHNPDAIRYNICKFKSEPPILLAQMGRENINISSMIKKANYNHLFFTNQDSENYQQKISPWEDLDLRLSTNQKKYSALSQAEKLSIYKYSDCFYETINNFMYNGIRVSNPVLAGCRQKKLDMKIHDVLVNLSLLASGINKIMPDHTVNPVFKGEMIGPKILNERINKIKNNELDAVPAFMSTSPCKKIADIFSKKSFIELDNSYAKDISGLSKHRGENEYLLNPNYILWENYSKNKGCYFFKGNVVAPLIPEPLPSPIEIEELETLKRFLKK